MYPSTENEAIANAERHTHTEREIETETLAMVWYSVDFSNQKLNARVYSISLEHVKCIEQKSSCMKHIYVANNKQASENSNPNSISNSIFFWTGKIESQLHKMPFYCCFSIWKKVCFDLLSGIGQWIKWTIKKPSNELSRTIRISHFKLKIVAVFWLNFQVTRNQMLQIFDVSLRWGFSEMILFRISSKN